MINTERSFISECCGLLRPGSGTEALWLELGSQDWDCIAQPLWSLGDCTWNAFVNCLMVSCVPIFSYLGISEG